MLIERKISLAQSVLRGATPREIRLALAPLVAINLSNMPVEWELALPIYVEALSDIPLDLLRNAIMMHIRSSEWFPKPSQLRALICGELDRRRDALSELKIEQIELQRPPEPELIRVTEQEAAAIFVKYGVTRLPPRYRVGLPEEPYCDPATAKRVSDGLKGFRHVPMPWLGESDAEWEEPQR